MSWLPDDFAHPLRAELTTGQHLRPMGPEDTGIDHPAVMSSRERLWSVYGEAWGWPRGHLPPGGAAAAPPRHAREIAAHESFLYGLFEDDEAELLGCLYIDPPTKAGDVGGEVSWWVVDRLVGSEVERALDEFAERWLRREWPLPAPPRFVGRDLSWAEWNALPLR